MKVMFNKHGFALKIAVFTVFLLLSGCSNLFMQQLLSQKNVPAAIIPEEIPFFTAYTVTFDSNGGSPVDSQSVASGDTAFRPSTPVKTGYGFVNWYASENLSGDPYDFDEPVTGDLTLYALWSQIYYTVIFNFNFDDYTESQQIGPGGITSRPDEPARPAVHQLYLGANAEPGGYLIEGWYIDSGFSIQWDFNNNTITGPVELYARWNGPIDVSAYGKPADNDVIKAIAYVNDNPDLYTLLVGDDVNILDTQVLNVAGVDLTIQGYGMRREIRYDGIPGSVFLNIEDGSSLTLGQNITISASPGPANLVSVRKGSLVMKDGSKITGHTASVFPDAAACAVYVRGTESSFLMEGGEISENHTASEAPNASGGLFIEGGATFTMSGGRIIGNTGESSSARNNRPSPADITVHGYNSIAISGGAVIGVITLGTTDEFTFFPSIGITGTWTGSVDLVNLYFSGSVIDDAYNWENRQIVTGISHTLTIADIGKFKLGDFRTDSDMEPIRYTSFLGTDDGSIGLLIKRTDTGEPGSEYLIFTEDDLRRVGTGAWELDKNYKLMNDIILEAVLTPIGDDRAPFKGSFDGQNYSIINLKIESSDDLQALFGNINLSGIVKNLGLANCVISGSDSVGGIAGLNYGHIQNCAVSGIISGTGESTGGVAGLNSGIIENCYTAGSMNGGALYTGGLTGYNCDGGFVINCYSTASINGASYLGGIAGSTVDGSTVANCYATGSVNGDSYAGGLAGSINSISTLQNNAALNPNVTADRYTVGRVIGFSTGSAMAMLFNYALKEMSVSKNPVSIQPDSADGGDITAEQYHNAGWWTSEANWAFGGVWDINVWNISDGKLPTLRNMPGKPEQNPVVQ